MNLASRCTGTVLGLALALSGCADGIQPAETGGSSGSGGYAAVASEGLWSGQNRGVEVCFFVSTDGRELTATGSGCQLSDGETRSFALQVDGVGVDQAGEPCGFGLAYAEDVPVDPETRTFVVKRAPASEADRQVSFSGELVGQRASGVARLESNGSFCEVGWAASKVANCDQAAIDACEALRQCCLDILINPVFFESCNSVVLQCDATACQALLDGYPRCRERD